MPQSKPFRSGKILSALGRDVLPETSPSRSGSLSGDLDQSTALSSLRELIAAGDHRLDPLLGSIADAARQLTGASGAALAMWKDGDMVCRARSGNTAPALGARLNAERGISGECLRSGKIQHCTDSENDPLVDVEVCRSLGLRSIAVLPIPGWRGINGILEVLATRPAAFSEQHITVLQQLAALAERARASQPHGASSDAPKPSSAGEKPQRSGLLPASDRVGDVMLASLDPRSRPFVLGAIGLGAASLLALAIWLGWRGPDETDGKAHAATAASVSVSAAALNNTTAKPPGNDPVWKANPGGEVLIPLSAKPSAGAPVKFASKVDVLARKKIQAGRSSSLSLSLSLTDLAADVTVRHEVPSSPTGTYSGETAGAQPSLAAPAALVSGKFSGGQLLRRVEPVYPAEALLSRLEGKVILAATVMEDGTVGDVKVVEGLPELSPSAVDAVKHWRYEPFELDGKPVKNEIGIKIDFKLPD
ncbi:MAG TPA: TonB family protein [Terriglobales bacterium]|nr:TonB family protein [Terriglobales bacterium]